MSDDEFSYAMLAWARDKRREAEMLGYPLFKGPIYVFDVDTFEVRCSPLRLRHKPEVRHVANRLIGNRLIGVYVIAENARGESYFVYAGVGEFRAMAGIE